MNFQIVLYKDDTETNTSQNWKNTAAWQSDWQGMKFLIQQDNWDSMII